MSHLGAPTQTQQAGSVRAEKFLYVWDRLKVILPSLPGMVFLVFLAKFVFTHFYEILAVMLLFFTDKAFQREAMFIVAVLGVVCAVAYIILYYSVWSMLFPSYVIVKDGVKTVDGRCYWHTKNLFSQTGEKLLQRLGVRVEKKKEMVFWVNRGRFLNVFVPHRSMTKIIVSSDTKFDRDRAALYVYEQGTRKIDTSTHERVIRVVPDPVASEDVDNEWVKDVVVAETEALVETAQTASHGDVAIQKMLLTDGAHLLGNTVKEEIEDAERRRQIRSSSA